jgi:hypothetical protein
MKHYRTLASFKKDIQHIKKEDWTDWIKIGKDWYVNEEFDSEGKNMRFTSITARQHLDIDTSNRYSEAWLSDAIVKEYLADCYRFYPEYYIEKKDFLKLSKTEQQTLLRYIGTIWGNDRLVDMIIEYLY